MVDLVPLAQATEDRDGVLDARLVDDDGLESALECRVLLDALAVLVEGSGADAVQLAARQHRLEHVAGVHGALRRSRADDRVQLVDEQDDLATRGSDFLEDGLEPLLELAAVLGTGHHGAQVQGNHPLVTEPLGHVPAHDALRQPLNDRRLADAGLTDQHRVVLGAPAEDLDDAPDLLVPSDHRVEQPAACGIGQVAAVLLEGFVGGFRVGCRHAL